MLSQKEICGSPALKCYFCIRCNNWSLFLLWLLHNKYILRLKLIKSAHFVTSLKITDEVLPLQNKLTFLNGFVEFSTSVHLQQKQQIGILILPVFLSKRVHIASSETGAHSEVEEIGVIILHLMVQALVLTVQ